MSFYCYIADFPFTGPREEVLVLYPHSNGSHAGTLVDAIEDLGASRLTPSRIIFVCPRESVDAIRAQYVALPATSLDRLRATPYRAILPYDDRGRLASSPIMLAVPAGETWNLTDDTLAELTKLGFRDLVSQSKTLVPAPLGHVFRKPSDNLSLTFIRAGHMLKSPAALALIHHAMLRVVPSTVARLYIDSFTILPVAMYFQAECAKLDRASGREPRMSVINFHSYDIDSKFLFPADGDYHVLISASASGDLARKLSDDYGAEREKITHLLAFSADERLARESVYFEYLPEDRPVPRDHQLKEISIAGEEFMAAHAEPSVVRLGKPHLSPREGLVFVDPFYQEALRLRLAAAYDQAFAPFELQAEAATGGKELEEWLALEITTAIPASVRAILAVDEHQSTLLARKIRDLLQAKVREPITLSTTDASDLEACRRDKGTVLVVCSEESSGDRLLQASTLLRSAPECHRHYVIAHLFFESIAQFKKLKSNLVTTGSGHRDYGWSLFIGVPVGTIRQHVSWQTERRFLTAGAVAGSGIDNDLQTALSARAGALEGTRLGHAGVFLPAIDGTPLQLRATSVLFPDRYATGDISQVTVYLMISSLLQRARDKEDADGRPLKGDLFFDRNPFVDSVLDPGTFARFNDGVVQAAVLRACWPDELNYSRSHSLSHHMATILRSVIAGRSTQAGEACLEFLYALAIDKIRLEKKDRERIEELIGAEPMLAAFWRLFRTDSAL